MKNTLRSTLTLLALATGLSISAADEAPHHDHDSKFAAPNGGRLVKSVSPIFEFKVAENGYATITFLSDQGERMLPEEQVVTLIGGDRSNPVRRKFVEKGSVLVSARPLPIENNMPIILTIKTTPDAKPVHERFNLNLATCPECSLHEYACSCDHH